MAAFVLGAISILIVVVHFAAGPFAPQPKAGVSIGEIAAEIREAATRAIQGIEQPPPQTAPFDIDRSIKIAAQALAAIAIIAGLFALIRRETWRPAATGIALGASAVAMQFFIWAAMLFAGAILLAAIVQNIGGILGE